MPPSGGRVSRCRAELARRVAYGQGERAHSGKRDRPLLVRLAQARRSPWRIMSISLRRRGLWLPMNGSLYKSAWPSWSISSGSTDSRGDLRPRDQKPNLAKPESKRSSKVSVTAHETRPPPASPRGSTAGAGVGGHPPIPLSSRRPRCARPGNAPEKTTYRAQPTGQVSPNRRSPLSRPFSISRSAATRPLATPSCRPRSKSFARSSCRLP